MTKIDQEELLPDAKHDKDQTQYQKAASNTMVDDTHEGEGDEGNTVLDDPRFNPPPPSPWKRVALIVLVVLLFYFGFQMRAALLRDRKPKVIYASRYSKEHKFRPAASPIITETLKDGRIRLRGALPTPTPTPTPTKAPAKKRRSSKAGRAGGKAKRKKAVPVAARQ